MITLRPQQVDFENAIREAFRTNRCVLGTAPTGFGKGVVIGDMGLKAAAKGNEVLIVTNRRQIVRQLTEHCQRAGLHTGIIMGSDEPDHEAPVQIASIQTLKRRKFAGLNKPGFIIVDEAHQENTAYAELLQKRFPNTRALGLTATPVGPGGSRLGHFDTIVEPIKNTQVIAAGHLLKARYIAPCEPDLGGINLRSASKDEIGEAVDVCEIYGDVFKWWEPYRHMQTMVVLPSRAVCNRFHEMATSRGISAKVVDGTTQQEERNDTFSEFKASDCQMILGVDVIREGLDLPVAQCLIDLQPTYQFRVYWQKLGRVKRPHDGQEEAIVLDFAGNLWRHDVHPDQDPPWDEVTNDLTIEEVNEKRAGKRCPKCGSKDIYGPANGLYKCEDCGEEFAAKPPWICPHCKQGLSPFQKVIGGLCPNCSAKVGSKPTRQIRMKDGSMREVPAEEVKKRKKCNADSDQAAWTKWLYIARNSNIKLRREGKNYQRDLNWCKVMFKKTEKHEPPPHLKNMPTERGDWKRAPEALYPWLNKKGSS
mgnify:CR=1 FL=1